MTELDRTNLERVSERARREIGAHDRRRRNQPLREAFEKQLEAFQTSFIPDLMAEPEARVRKSVLRLEAKLRELPDRQREVEAEWELLLASARKRTNALSAWRDSLG
jgi:hypothetical protein